MPYFDSHVHSQFSNDSRQTAETIARAALALNLAGAAVTDHANLSISAEDRTLAQRLLAKNASAVPAGAFSFPPSGAPRHRR